MPFSILCERGNAVQFSAGLFLGRSWGLPFWAASFSIPFEGEMLRNFLWGCAWANFGVYHFGPCPFVFYVKGGMLCNSQRGYFLGDLGVYHFGPHRFPSHLKGKCCAIFCGAVTWPILESTILGDVLFYFT